MVFQILDEIEMTRNENLCFLAGHFEKVQILGYCWFLKSVVCVLLNISCGYGCKNNLKTHGGKVVFSGGGSMEPLVMHLTEVRPTLCS